MPKVQPKETGILHISADPTTITDGQYADRTDITQAIFDGANIESIGNNSFQSCTNLLKINLEDCISLT